MTPEAALRRVFNCLNRAHETGFKAKAFTPPPDVVRCTPADEIERRGHNDSLQEHDGVGKSTAAVIIDAPALMSA